MSKILMVLTSHNILGSTGRPTGFWLEEFTAPYYVFHDAGEKVKPWLPRRADSRRSIPRATIRPTRPSR